MFGILRYFLALMVVQTHIWKIIPWAGNYAVFTFYVLSGYLMTLVINEKYPLSVSGLGGYFRSRILRIYPLYFVALLLSILVVHYMPRMALTAHKDFSMPVSQYQWLKNIFIIGANHPTVSTLVIPAWSLHVELLFYALMGLGLSRNRWTAFVWFAASLGWTISMARQHPTECQFWYYRYFPAEAASLPFSMGACAWYLRNIFRGKYLLAALALSLLIGHMVSAGALWKGVDEIYTQGFYVSMGLGMFAVALLGGVDRMKVPPVLKSIDTFLGNLAYPIFLFHIQVSALVLPVLFKGRMVSRGMLFAYSLPFIHMVAYLMFRGFEKRIDALRKPVIG